MRAALAPHDLTHVQFVLLASLWWLEDHGEPPTQALLAEHAGTDAMMTSQVIRKLEDRALVLRTTDRSDARARRLALTAGGRATVTRALADVEDADAAFFASLGEDRGAFLRALGSVSRSPGES
ncbi:MAG: MarR family transcriptional regulator [Solirubrobacteraceae bacterium]|jgi:DNA-binding MarR family transcriptional regulator